MIFTPVSFSSPLMDFFTGYFIGLVEKIVYKTKLIVIVDHIKKYSITIQYFAKQLEL